MHCTSIDYTMFALFSPADDGEIPRTILKSSKCDSYGLGIFCANLGKPLQ